MEKSIDEFTRIIVHKDLVKEFDIRKKQYEDKLGYAIKGGTPIVSKICAEILKKQRQNTSEPIRIEFKKIAGKKKNKLIFV